MRRLSLCLTSLVGVVLLLPQAADGQKKENKKGPPAEAATAQDYTALNQVAELEGRLMMIDPNGKGLTIRVEFKHLEPNVGGQGGKGGNVNNQQYQNFLRQQQQLYREYEQIQRIKNPAQQQQRMQQLWARMQAQAAKSNVKANFPGAMPGKDPFKVVTSAKDYELETTGEVRVARASLAMEYDDKGNIKQYSAEELKKLRDTVLPGYKSKFEELEAGQLVKLYLVKAKAPAKGKDVKPAPKIPAGDEKVEGTLPNVAITGPAAGGPQVRMILIQSEADPSFLPKQKGDQKKKKKN